MVFDTCPFPTYTQHLLLLDVNFASMLDEMFVSLL